MTPGLVKSIFVIAAVIWGIAGASLGLGVVPMFYMATGFLRFTEYGFVRSLACTGALVFAPALGLFYLAHHDLGRNFRQPLIHDFRQSEARRPCIVCAASAG